jgi:hypothetical protein
MDYTVLYPRRQKKFPVQMRFYGERIGNLAREQSEDRGALFVVNEMADSIKKTIPGDVNSRVHEIRGKECSTTGREESGI